MGFIGFILFILIIVFVILPVMFLSRLFGGISGFFRRNQGQNPFFSGDYRSSDRPERNTRRKGRRKVFDKSDGEYVEFEEIIEERHTEVEGESRRCDIEDQVSDAEWTEIK